MARLVGIGVGPGDPELLTLKAVRLIAASAVVFCPAARNGAGRAERIGGSYLEDKLVVRLDLEMGADQQTALDRAAETVEEQMAGRDAVFLTEGDPTLYSTFGLLVEALRQRRSRIEVAFIPGVTSITAAAAAAGTVLAQGDDSLVVIPGTDAGMLEDAAATYDRIVVIKPSAGGQELTRRLQSCTSETTMVAEASSSGQLIARDMGSVGALPYFSILLGKGRPPVGGGRVHFVGSGPGAAGHLTRLALATLRAADLVVAADSLVSPEVIQMARRHTRVIRTASLTLEDWMPLMIDEARRGGVVARLHSGDPALYGAIGEQMRWLEAEQVAYEVVPGVSSVFAAAAAMGIELTRPGGSQTVILTRMGRRVATPDSERLRDLARHNTTLAIFLSVAHARAVQQDLLAAGMDPQTPTVIAYKVAWPDQLLVRSTLGQLATEVRQRNLTRHALILVGSALTTTQRRSRLYNPGHAHILRGHQPRLAPPMTAQLAVASFSEPGLRLARKLQRHTPGSMVYGSAHLLRPQEMPIGPPSQGLAAILKMHQAVVLVMALGIAVRLVGPLLKDKRTDPAVVVVDAAGHHAISLAGARSMGANQLAEWVGAVLGATTVITTAAEALGLPALDRVFADRGWVADNDHRLTTLEAAVVNGQLIGVLAPKVRLRGWPPAIGIRRFRTPAAALASGLPGVVISDHEISGVPKAWARVWTRRLVLGVGCSSLVTAAQMWQAVSTALNGAGIDRRAVGLLATIDGRRDHEAVRSLGERLGTAVRAYPAEELARVSVPNPSPAVASSVGSPSVAEAAAIMASGGVLILPKQIHGQVTVAIAERPG